MINSLIFRYFFKTIIISGELCAADLEALSQWTFDLTVADDSLLTESGKTELKKLGQRYKARLPDLLGGSYNQEEIMFRTTDRQRTIESGKAFSQGVFPDEEVILPPPLEEDKLLRYYDFCQKWSTYVEDNEETYLQMELFKESQPVKVHVLWQKIGLNDYLILI